MSRLREIRESRGLRKEDVASKAVISVEYVRLLEAPDPPVPGLAIARRLAKALGVTIDELFPTEHVEGTDPEPSVPAPGDGQ